MSTYLEEGILLVTLQLVGAKELDTTSSLGVVQPRFCTLQQFEDVINHDGLQIDLVLIIKVLRTKLDLKTSSVSSTRPLQIVAEVANLGHVHLRV